MSEIMSEIIDVKPLVSIILPVYNGAKYLKESIDSILGQTYDNFELIIINDGSIDDSLSIMKSYSDGRIRIINNEINLKLIGTLNKGILLSKGKYIARMDADDISLPTRLEKQIALLELNPAIGLVGTSFEKIGDETGIVHYPLDHENLKFSAVYFNPFLHPSVVIRKSILEDNNLKFNFNYLHAEEYKLWTELLLVTRACNIQIPLMQYRIHAIQISQRFADVQLKTSKLISKEYLLNAGFIFDENEWDYVLNMHKILFDEMDINYFFVANKWYVQNNKLGCFDKEILMSFISRKCKNILINQRKLKWNQFFKIVKSELFLIINCAFFSKILFFKKLL